ncbi:hypothetical protein CWI36_1330p0010 [Hamiltosporidium magnivora]|uniref:Uncharacterized protein n=1 Tax=Hamiltosporidium magnivora TaxID=148818 RepID=A0A4Q9L2Z2_9MICR|nr:hypothetical protein CWI36_1330p0010 [Hamiltosporidium magnivora]
MCKNLDSLNLEYNHCAIICFYDSNTGVYDISIIFEKLNLKQIIIENTIIEKNFREIVIKDSKMYSNFLNDVFRITILECLIIIESDMLFEKKIIFEATLSGFFTVKSKNYKNFILFSKIIKFMSHLKEIELHYYNV